MNNSQVSLLLFFFLFSFSAISQIDSTTVNNQPFERLKFQLDSVIANAISHKAFPGCVVYAANRDRTIFFEAYGHHTYDSLRKVERSDIYDIASVTKIVGATIAIMRLYDDGLIDLDDPIKKYVSKIGGRVGNVTIREALAHQGGVYPWIPYHLEIRKANGQFKRRFLIAGQYEGFDYAISDSLNLHNDFYTTIKRYIRKSKVQKNPSYKYSGLFFYLVPEIVERLSGIAFDEYLLQNFYEPMMANTLCFNPLERFSKHQIVPTEIDTFFRMELIHGRVHDEGAIMMGGVSGNAGLFSNAEDLSKILKVLLQNGFLDSSRYLSPQVVDLFTSTPYANRGNRRGLGFDKPLLVYDSKTSSVAKDASFRSFGHTGYTGTLVWVDPDADLIFIFLSNRVYPSRENTAIYQLNVRPTIHQLIYDYLREDETKIDGPVEKRK